MNLSAVIFTHGPDFPLAEQASLALHALGIPTTWCIHARDKTAPPAHRPCITSAAPRLGNLNGSDWLREELRTMRTIAGDAEWILKVDSDTLVLSLDWLRTARPGDVLVGFNYASKRGADGLFGLAYAVRTSSLDDLITAADALPHSIIGEDMLLGTLARTIGSVTIHEWEQRKIFAAFSWKEKEWPLAPDRARNWARKYQVIVFQRQPGIPPATARKNCAAAMQAIRATSEARVDEEFSQNLSHFFTKRF